MQKKLIRKSNKLKNKSQLKIPQPKILFISTYKQTNNKKKNDINSLGDINLYGKHKNAYNNRHNIKKSKSSYKDSLDQNISESKINILIPDSLNNTKRSIIHNKIINASVHFYETLNNMNKKNLNNENDRNKNEEETKKIDYKYYTNYPMKDYLSNQNSIYSGNKNEKNIG